MRRGRWFVAALMAIVLGGCQSATVLQDGRVLLVTGAGASLYDPVANSITPTGVPGAMRVAHSATLLQDGRVLLAGGAEEGGSLTSAELFDPVTGTFTPTGSLVEGRSLHSATLLGDGRVLLAGGGVINAGDEESPPPLTSAEVFDPATGTFTAADPMGGPRAMHSATLLHDGTVLLIGGSGGDMVLTSMERFDPATGSFSGAGALATGRALHTATLIDDGSVLVVGGMSQSGAEAETEMLDSIERYDPASGTVTQLGTLGTPRGGHTATLLPDGHVLVIGGMDAEGAGIASAELVDPATGAVTPTGDMAKGRGLHSASLLPGGDVLVVGGEFDQATVEGADPLGTPERYRAATGTFEVLGG